MRLPKNVDSKTAIISPHRTAAAPFHMEALSQILAGFILSWYSAPYVKKTCEAQNWYTSNPQSIELLSSQLIFHTPHKAQGHSLLTIAGITNMAYSTFTSQLLAITLDLSSVWGFSSNINYPQLHLSCSRPALSWRSDATPSFSPSKRRYKGVESPVLLRPRRSPLPTLSNSVMIFDCLPFGLELQGEQERESHVTDPRRFCDQGR